MLLPSRDVFMIIKLTYVTISIATIFISVNHAQAKDWFFPVPQNAEEEPARHMDKVYRTGMYYGYSDKMNGLSREPARYWNTVAITDCVRFNFGYQAGYNKEVVRYVDNTRALYDIAKLYGRADKRKGLSSEPSRYWSRFDFKQRREFSLTYQSGYAEAYPPGEQGNEMAQAYDVGLYHGRADQKKGINRQPSRYWNVFDLYERDEFSEGYHAGYTNHSLGRVVELSPRGLGVFYGHLDKQKGLDADVGRYSDSVESYRRPAFSEGYQIGYEQSEALPAAGLNFRKILINGNQIYISQAGHLIRTFYSAEPLTDNVEWYKGQDQIVVKSRAYNGHIDTLQLLNVKTGGEEARVRVNQIRDGEPPWAAWVN